MAKTDSVKISLGSPLGRIGSAVGQGLGESLPKEVERQRLRGGLQEFAKQAPNLSPLEAAANYLSIPGISPQAIQILPELIRQAQRRQSYSEFAGLSPEQQAKQQTLNQLSQRQSTPEGEIGFQSPSATAATIRGYVPPTQADIIREAEKLPMYQYDPEGAINLIRSQAQSEQQQVEAQKENLRTQTALQDRVKSSLAAFQPKEEHLRVPDDEYLEIENEVLANVNKGMTEEKAIKRAAEDMKKRREMYSNLANVGGFSVMGQSPKRQRDVIDNVVDQAWDYGENTVRNVFNKLVNSAGLSFPKAAVLSYPLKKFPELQKTIDKLPDISASWSPSNPSGTKEPKLDPEAATNYIAPQLVKLMGKQGSPLAIGEHLAAKGYDPKTWMDYLRQNQKVLNLTNYQNDELQKSVAWWNTLPDLWLFSLIGENKYIR